MEDFEVRLKLDLKGRTSVGAGAAPAGCLLGSAPFPLVSPCHLAPPGSSLSVPAATFPRACSIPPSWSPASRGAFLRLSFCVNISFIINFSFYQRKTLFHRPLMPEGMLRRQMLFIPKSLQWRRLVWTGRVTCVRSRESVSPTTSLLLFTCPPLGIA